MYRIRSGKVYGGSKPKDGGRSVKDVAGKSNEEYQGGIYKMIWDRTNENIKLEFEDGEEVILDNGISNSGNFEFSPIVIIHGYSIKVSVL